MKVLLTGLNGTLAPKVAAEFARQGAACVGWDRGKISPEDRTASSNYLDKVHPDAICHLAMGSESWAGSLAGYAAEKNILFLFTSTAMVFHHEPDGPHHPDDDRTAQDDYGRYKIRCEDAVRAKNPNAIVARIGWQIDPSATGNNMLAHLDQQQERDGKIQASRLWIPACSFMTDTAAALWQLLNSRSPGVHHIDSNAQVAWTFDRIVAFLKKKFSRNHWKIEVTESYAHDQRLAAKKGSPKRGHSLTL